MKLPAELRNRIYELALPRTSIRPKNIHSEDGLTSKQPAPSLLFTCIQTHDEAIGLYYSNTSFWFEDPQDIHSRAKFIGSTHLSSSAKQF